MESFLHLFLHRARHRQADGRTVTQRQTDTQTDTGQTPPDTYAHTDTDTRQRQRQTDTDTDRKYSVYTDGWNIATSIWHVHSIPPRDCSGCVGAVGRGLVVIVPGIGFLGVVLSQVMRN